MRLLRHRQGNPETEYVEAYHTAPPLDSTLCHGLMGKQIQSHLALAGAGDLHQFYSAERGFAAPDRQAKQV